jgi:hypothetical protein
MTFFNLLDTENRPYVKTVKSNVNIDLYFGDGNHSFFYLHHIPAFCTLDIVKYMYNLKMQLISEKPGDIYNKSDFNEHRINSDNIALLILHNFLDSYENREDLSNMNELGFDCSKMKLYYTFDKIECKDKSYIKIKLE